ncbi:MAG TPA: NTP transferase domain-containing protein [Gaiella sp.]|nr:NTP transferase domain-containing protein [Gaiella sp.]
MVVAVPFRAGGKSRLPDEIRAEVALAMLGDVVGAAVTVGDVRVVTDDPTGSLVASELGATVVEDPGGGQGAAVLAALAGVEGICLVVNADLPRLRPSDLNALAVPPRLGKVAIVEAPDGTTNALGLPLAEVFQPLYGPGSAGQFRAHAVALDLPFEGLALQNLVEDVDTLDDLRRVGTRAGARTRAILEAIPS